MTDRQMQATNSESNLPSKSWNFLEYLPENVKLDEAKLTRVEKILTKYDRGPLYTVVLVCRGEKHCPYKGDCPVQDHIDSVIGHKCPLERTQ